MSRTADSILTLQSQINERAPHRNKIDDGTIGDARHAALGNKSDHNPWYKGIVTAIDVTHDPAGGFDCNELWSSLRQSKDPRIKYIIFQKRIVDLTPGHWSGGSVREYTGINAHADHLHLSVRPELCDSTLPWKLWIFRWLTLGMWNGEVGLLQHRLNMFNANIIEDTKFGPITEAAVRAFQRSRSTLTVDGVVGLATRRALGM